MIARVINDTEEPLDVRRARQRRVIQRHRYKVQSDFLALGALPINNRGSESQTNHSLDPKPTELAQTFLIGLAAAPKTVVHLPEISDMGVRYVFH